MIFEFEFKFELSNCYFSSSSSSLSSEKKTEFFEFKFGNLAQLYKNKLFLYFKPKLRIF